MPAGNWDLPSNQVDRLSYLLSHGAKENLVARPQDWPGVHCVDALLTGRLLEGTWFDRTQEYNARQRGKDVPFDRFATYRLPAPPITAALIMFPALAESAAAT